MRHIATILTNLEQADSPWWDHGGTELWSLLFYASRATEPQAGEIEVIGEAAQAFISLAERLPGWEDHPVLICPEAA
ncbi:hypothetical protein ACFL2Q_06050 [Thermodesulfobacteriota bacterium]